MNLDGQLERLAALYDEQSDEALLNMHANREDLTELAQHALAQVMRSRHLSPAPSYDATQPAPQSSQVPLAPDSPIAADEVCLCSFTDAIEADQALQCLTDAGITPRAADLNPPDANKPRRMIEIGVVVRRADEHAARSVLAQKLNLTTASPSTNPFLELDGLLQVGVFNRADALIAADTLGKAGISFIWNDDRDDPQATGDNVSIEVKAPRLDQAHTLIDAAFEQTP